MRMIPVLPVLLVLLALPVRAQVSVDLNALDQLNKAQAQDRTGEPAPKPKPPKATAAKPKPPASTEPTSTAKPPAGFHAPSPALPAGPPPDAKLAPLPPPAPAAQKPSSLPPPAVLPTAPGNGASIAGGLRISFGGNDGELSPASEQSIQALVRQMPKSDTISYNVLAYAHGTPEDPSTARRLSLARGLAVRSVLMNAGVPSSRIYVRALGAVSDNGSAGNAPLDRVDIGVLGTNASQPAETAKPEATSPALSPTTPNTGAARTP